MARLNAKAFVPARSAPPVVGEFQEFIPYPVLAYLAQTLQYTSTGTSGVGRGGGGGAWMRVQVIRRFKFPYAFAYIFRFRGAQNHTVTSAKLRELSRPGM